MLNEFLKNPVSKSKKRGTVSKNYTKPSKEDVENMEAATIVANVTGRNLILLKPKNQPNVKTADSIDQDSGELWEIKTNKTATHSAIDKALRRANKQANGVILNLKSDISNDILLNAIKCRLPKTDIQKIIIIKNTDVFEYDRKYFI